MVKRLRITITIDDERSEVHWDSAPGTPADYTLCGLETMGDPPLGLTPAVETTDPVDCPHCVAIVNHVTRIIQRGGEL